MQRISTCSPGPTWQISRASTSSIWPYAFDTTPIGNPTEANRSSALLVSGIIHRQRRAPRVRSNTSDAAARSPGGTPIASK